MNGSSYLEIGIAAISTAFLLFPARWLLSRAGIIDRPNERSSHKQPTVRGGGIAIVVVMATALGVFAARNTPDLWAVLVAFVGLAAVSFIDDVRGVKVGIRFAVQMVSSVMAVEVLFRSTVSGVTEPISPVVAAIAVAWIVGYTNAFNFMDGINGIAAIQAISTGLGTALVGHAAGVSFSHPALALALIVAGAALGFLPHNFPNARVFMGDVSSATLGFLLATLAFWITCLTNVWMLLWLALLHANFVLDTAITMARRARRGEKVWQPHREHFYQRLVRAGQSHVRVSISEGILQVAIATVVVWGTNAPAMARIFIGVVVVTAWFCYFGYADHAFRRQQPAPTAPAELR